MIIRIKDGIGLIGLFYIIEGKIISMQEDLEFRDPDSYGEIQPSENHEFLMNKIKFGNKFSILRNEYSDVINEDLEVDTLPRGRVYYNTLDRKFYVATSNAIISKYKNDILEEFNLPANTIFQSEYEYETYDETLL